MKKYIKSGAVGDLTTCQESVKKDYASSEIKDTAPMKYAVVNGMVIPVNAAIDWDFK